MAARSATLEEEEEGPDGEAGTAPCRGSPRGRRGSPRAQPAAWRSLPCRRLAAPWDDLQVLQDGEPESHVFLEITIESRHGVEAQLGEVVGAGRRR